MIESRRTRWVIAPVVVLGFHAALLAWMAMRPVAISPSPFVMNVSLEPGALEGLGAFPVSDPAPPLEEPDTAKPDDAEPQPETSEASQAEQAPDEVEPVTPEDTVPPAPAEDAALPEETAEATDPAASADILAMVEKLTGQTAEAVDAKAQTVTKAQPWTPAQASKGGGCAIAAQIQTAFRDEPTLNAAVSAIPRDGRSVANAIQLWNGDWVEPIDTQQAIPLATLRQAIDAIIVEAPRPCRLARVQGPVFMLVEDSAESPVVIVIGRDDWRWVDLSQAQQSGRWPWLRWRTDRRNRAGG